jgi:DNA-binding CsgD family transcriptional regulator
MMKTIIALFTWLFRLGTENSEDFEQAKKIEFTNRIAVLYFCIGVFYAALFLALKLFVLMGILATASVIYPVCLYLNYKKKYDCMRFLVVLNTTLPIYLATAMTGKAVLGHVFLIFLFAFSIMVFSEFKKSVGALLVPSTAYLLLELTNYHFFYHSPLSESVTRFLSITVFIMTCIVLCFMVVFYKNLISHMRHAGNQLFKLYPLTPRELEVLSEMINGKSNKQIATYLFIEESTVKTHLKNIFRKLNVSTRAEIFALLVNK